MPQLSIIPTESSSDFNVYASNIHNALVENAWASENISDLQSPLDQGLPTDGFGHVGFQTTSREYEEEEE